MAQVIVRNIDEDIKTALKRRARQHGWSMEEEARQILRRAVNEEPAAESGLGTRMAARFADMGLEEPLTELHGQDARAMPVDP